MKHAITYTSRPSFSLAGITMPTSKKTSAKKSPVKKVASKKKPTSASKESTRKESTDDKKSGAGFGSFGLSKPVAKAIKDIGYESPSPIQEACIPPLLEGKDIIGQAQTGTGKTAAFALPCLSNIDLTQKNPQILVLAPTRELAIQVAEAIQSYARHMKGFHVLPIYGGQAYNIQLRPLKRGVHIVVGTPGRVMDHIKKGTLILNELKTLVLDEADEMLRMGFIDDVKWVMTRLPEKRQIALFSATMPDVIRRVAEQFLDKPRVIKIKTKTATATTIRQRYWLVSGTNKLDALTRILEVESFDALIIFVRTKTATTDLAEKLSARGFSADAINGDIPQKNRERIIDQLKKSRIDILIATDVAARGLDVPRISHVINYDIPYDPESYVHRIGRTGRAGKTGDAILFVAPRERRMLKTIERITRQSVEPMNLPSADLINAQRINSFKQKITDTMANRDLTIFQKMLQEYERESDKPLIEIAAALGLMAQGKEALLVSQKRVPIRDSSRNDSRRQNRDYERNDSRSSETKKPFQRRESTRPVQAKAQKLKDDPDIEMIRYKIDVGHNDDVKPGNIVGAIANEGEIESRYIGSIEIYDDFSTIDLPAGMPGETQAILKKTWVCGKTLNLTELKKTSTSERNNKPPKKKSGAGKKKILKRNTLNKGTHKQHKK